VLQITAEQEDPWSNTATLAINPGISVYKRKPKSVV